VLTTAHPEYFEPFGFRAVPEQVFTTAVRSRNSPARLRAIDVADPADRRLVHRLLESRAPLSDVLGVGADQAVLAFNEVRGPLWHSDRLDCLMLLDRSGTRLRLYEVIGPRVPSLEALLEVVAGEVEEVITFFPPERLGGGFTPRDHDLAGGDYAMDRGGDNTYLMVRGPFPSEASHRCYRGRRGADRRTVRR